MANIHHLRQRSNLETLHFTSSKPQSRPLVPARFKVKHQRLERVKHFVLRQYHVASVPQPRGSRRSASMKFWQNFTIPAVAARRLRQTQRQRTHIFKTLASILLPSCTSNDALRHRPGGVPGFRHFRATLNFQNFPTFQVFFAG